MRALLFVLLTLPMALPAAPAIACPVAEDLDRGLVLVREVRNFQGVFHEQLTYLRRAGPGVLASTFHPQLTDDHWQNLDLGGVLALSSERTSGALAATGTFAPEVAALFPLGANEQHRFDGLWQRDDSIWRSTYDLETGDATTAMIGDCAYDAVPFVLTDTRTLPDGSISESWTRGHYIPELMLLRADDTARERVIALRRPSLVERFFWPFRGL